MNSMRNVGISISLIFEHLASQCGGYQHVGCTVKDMHNQVTMQCRQLPGDAKSAVVFLEELATMDRCLFFSYNMDEEGLLRTLF